jgi:hypothetical protein
MRQLSLEICYQYEIIIREIVALLYNESDIYCIAIMLPRVKSECIHFYSHLALNNKSEAANVFSLCCHLCLNIRTSVELEMYAYPYLYS